MKNTDMVPLNPHDVAKEIASQYHEVGSLMEADTRYRIIDRILRDVLSWPDSAVFCESYINPGYADYVLTGPNDTKLLFIEAKKEGIGFRLPQKFDDKQLSCFVKVATLQTDQEISKAMCQVQAYCVNSGCEYAGISNGHEWIFFKTFERHQDWRLLNALVICSPSYFADCFTDAVGILGYTAIAEKASLSATLGGVQLHRREHFFAKAKVHAYGQKVQQNYLATCLRPLADRYLGRMNPTDDEFMDQCYVHVRDYHASVTGVTQIIRDSLTPYFKNYNVQEFFDDSDGGALGSRIASHLRERRTREVVILFGGKGSGKSTFIRKLLYHRPPKEFREHSTIAVVDLLECPEDKGEIDKEIATQLLGELDKDKLLLSARETLLSLFADRYGLAQKQALAGMSPSGDMYNAQLNTLVQQWLADWQYCAARLADYWKTKQRGTIVVLDNTDQYSPEIQDYCFTRAQQIASVVDGLVVISMREERFHQSRLHGTLDAFQNNGFHLSSPPAQYVFIRRLAFMLKVLDDPESARKISPTLDDTRNGQVKQLLRMLIGEFRRRGSHLSEFLRASAHGNMRLALDMFRQFLLSGYTKVEEMISVGGWNLQVHQVLRPMMTPDRFFYDESLSSIPNVYQLRSDTSASHFTTLRILDIVSAGTAPQNPVFVPVSRLKAHFATRYNMLDDMRQNLDKLLQVGVLEADNRLDQYSEAVDSVKMTPYGFYLRDTLSCMFSYLDLVCMDCAVHDESMANSLVRMAGEELAMFFGGVRGERVELRLERVDAFINYLCKEAEKERDLYALEPYEIRYANELKRKFQIERERVRTSAERYVNRDERRWHQTEEWY